MFHNKCGNFKKPMLPLSSSLLPSSSIAEEGMWAKPVQIGCKNILGVLTIVPLMSSLYRDYEKSGKSTTSFTRTFIKILTTQGF